MAIPMETAGYFKADRRRWIVHFTTAPCGPCADILGVSVLVPDPRSRDPLTCSSRSIEERAQCTSARRETRAREHVRLRSLRLLEKNARSTTCSRKRWTLIAASRVGILAAVSAGFQAVLIIKCKSHVRTGVADLVGYKIFRCRWLALNAISVVTCSSRTAFVKFSSARLDARAREIDSTGYLLLLLLLRLLYIL